MPAAWGASRERASIAGAKRLREEGVIASSDRVVCVLTGHQLKDPTATVAYHGTDQDSSTRPRQPRCSPRGIREPARDPSPTNSTTSSGRSPFIRKPTPQQHPGRFDQTDTDCTDRARPMNLARSIRERGLPRKIYACRMSDGTSSRAEGAMLAQVICPACATEWADANVSCPACGFQHPPLTAAEDLIASWVVNSPIPPESSLAAQNAVCLACGYKGR